MLLASGGVSGFISASAQLVGAVAWPAVVVLLLFLFRPQLGSFFANLGSLNFHGFGVDLTANRVQAAAALGAATAARASDDTRPPDALADPHGLVAAMPTQREQRRLKGSRILWVDDQPRNTAFERLALEALGIRIDTAAATDEAIQAVGMQRYDLIISDMHHPATAQPAAQPGPAGAVPAGMPPKAGYALLDQLRQMAQTAPFVIYTLPEPGDGGAAEAQGHGAFAYTTNPQQLLTAVMNALASGNSR